MKLKDPGAVVGVDCGDGDGIVKGFIATTFVDDFEPAVG